MISSKQIKNILSEQDIFELLNDLGGEPEIFNNVIVSKTICHNGSHNGKKKLMYYPDSKIFKCYTECGSMDIFKLVGSVLNLDFANSFRYLCEKFNIYNNYNNYDSNLIDFSFFNKFKNKEEKIKLEILSDNVLKFYYDLYHISWINNGISIQSMKKFNIKFSIKDNQIIIPHYDINNRLIGVRARNLNMEFIELGKKYVPVYYKNKVLSYPTSANLYGLNINKENIKKAKTIILVEAEKSVLQSETMFPGNSIVVAMCGSFLSDYQINILRDLNIENCIIALDKEYNNTSEEKFYKNKIRETIINKLILYFNVSILWDDDELLNYKDSPLDHGIEVFNKLLNKKINIIE